MTEQFDLPLAGRAETTGHVELFRSYGRFETYFEDAARMRVVTYRDSPEFILELFDRVESLERLEVVVGDIADYRERLIHKPELANRLEQLKRDDKLILYLCETKEVHSKLYLVEYGVETDDSDGSDETDVSQQTFEWADSDSAADGDGTNTDESEDAAGTKTARSATVIVGSPNLSSNAWTRQANTGVVFETTTDTSLWGDFVDFYEEHRCWRSLIRQWRMSILTGTNHLNYKTIHILLL